MDVTFERFDRLDPLGRVESQDVVPPVVAVQRSGVDVEVPDARAACRRGERHAVNFDAPLAFDFRTLAVGEDPREIVLEKFADEREEAFAHLIRCLRLAVVEIDRSKRVSVRPQKRQTHVGNHAARCVRRAPPGRVICGFGRYHRPGEASALEFQSIKANPLARAIKLPAGTGDKQNLQIGARHPRKVSGIRAYDVSGCVQQASPAIHHDI